MSFYFYIPSKIIFKKLYEHSRNSKEFVVVENFHRKPLPILGLGSPPP
jgi:hypothetical protein